MSAKVGAFCFAIRTLLLHSSGPEGTYFIGFDCLEGRFDLKIRRRNQPCEMVGPSRARCTEKCGNLTVQGFIWEHFEAQWGLLGRALTSLGTVLASTWGPQAMFFHEFVEKV